MLRRPPIEGRGSSQQQKLLLAFAFILLPWLQFADAQQQHQQRQPIQHAVHSVNPLHLRDGSSRHELHDKAADVPVPAWEATPIKVDSATTDAPDDDRKRSTLRQQYEQKQQQQQARRDSKKSITNNNKNTRTNPIIIPDDASALATLAPAQPVRAPHPPRQLRSSSVPASGLASQQNARRLEDWEVEDFVLLATVDGDLYASDRKTGKERWHLEVDQPMVETVHHRANKSVLDDDYDAVDHYIWAVEPSGDGTLYVWIPDSDSGPGPRATELTMKRLVEELSPWSGEDPEDPPVVYTGDKKTTMITLDAATGRVLKWFGATGSHVNEAESCLKPNAIYDKDSQECSSTGTITLGRTEYTVGIHRRLDGKPIATLKYAEWSANNRDMDLRDQYDKSLDSRYILSLHDGQVYGVDYARTDNAGPAPLFSHKFTTPVARVFDVCRPWDAASESNPKLVVLPQPLMPSQEDQSDALKRNNSIFLNQTEAGSWYALSGRAYPLIIDAPIAQVSDPRWWDVAPPWDSLTEAKASKALIGTHSLETMRGNVRHPQGAIGGSEEDAENESSSPNYRGHEDPLTIINKVKSLPQSAAKSVVDFISNPILIILFFAAIVYNEKKLRRSYHRFRNGSGLKDTLLYLSSETVPDGKGDLNDDQSAKSPENDNSQPDSPAIASKEDLPQPAPSEPPATRESTLDEAAARGEAATTAESGDKDKSEETGLSQNKTLEGAEDGTPVKKTKKTHRGRRGGTKHKPKNNNTNSRDREASQSRDDDAPAGTVEDAVNIAKKLGDKPSLEPDVMTVDNDTQAVTGTIIRMGNIEVNTDEQLGTGSNGTLVFAGKFDGRDVAVKRMLIQFYDIASQETRLLRESDDHPNVIRYYSQQIRDGFLYIALERCAASLAEIVERPHAFRELANAGRLDLPGVLYQITNGLHHLHGLRIVHRDLKPQNILVNMGKDGRPRLLVSDFGLCKKLEGGQSSFGATTGRAAGTTGWRAPELLLDDDGKDLSLIEASTHSGSGSVLVGDGLNHRQRATRAIDIFSLGLVFFYVLTNGSHPFDCGDKYMREVNIRKGSFNLQPLDALGDFAYEAKDLIASMLEADPKRRPTAIDVMSHPFFWSAKKRLAFLCDVSDHFEKEPRDPPSVALEELERHAPEVTKNDFLRVLPREFLDSLGKQRKYTGSRLLDLLRALRNKRNHYEDMPDTLKRTVGPLPDGYLSFWTTRFPNLLLVCWNVVYNVQWEETDRFREYYMPAGL